MPPSRSEVIDQVAERLLARRPGHPLRVGIDGICGAGKSTFARELTDRIETSGRPVVHLDSDGFHHRRARRHQQGRASARGYYEDAYDFESLMDRVLRPLGPDGTRRYAVRVHDLSSDDVLDDVADAAQDAIVVFAATFLQRDGLRELWDEVVWLDADAEVALARGVARDSAALGGQASAIAAYETRYLAACRIYLAEQDPRGRASIVIDNTDLEAPVVELVHG